VADEGGVVGGAVGRTGHSTAGETAGTAVAAVVAAGGASGSAAGGAAAGPGGAFTAAIDGMERRLMLKLDTVIKKLTDERKVYEKANKNTRLQVAATLSEVQAIKRRSGKMVTSSDAATGSIKRIMDSVAALNRTLAISGTRAGAGLGLQVSADGGSDATDNFSGGAKQVPWVKGMVVRFLCN